MMHENLPDNVTVHGMEQRSEEWASARRGLITASQSARLLTPKKLELSTQHDDYARELAIELFLEESLEKFAGNDNTRRGELAEPLALKWYRDQTGNDMAKVGFMSRNDLDVGCSPDGFDFGPMIGCEIKSRGAKDHFKHVLKSANGTPADAGANLQCQFSMMVTGAEVWHQVMYHPRMSMVVPVVRDPEIVGSFETAAILTIEARNKYLAQLQEIFAEHVL